LGFLGFELRRVRSRQGAWRPHDPPQLKKRRALLGKLREVIRRYTRQAVGKVRSTRSWVNYFALGHSSRCFRLSETAGEARTERVEKPVATNRHLVKSKELL
jgi:RNA-directed DNA polymerase